LRLYIRFLSIHLKSQMQYKLSFFLTMAGWIMMSFLELLSVTFVFARFHSVAGFSLREVLLCFATMMMAFNLAELLGRGFDVFARMLGNGEFDRVLVRPRRATFLVLASQIEFARIGRLLQGIAVFIYVIPRSEVVWTADKILTLILMIVGGTLVFFCLFLIYAAYTFFTTEGLEVLNIFIYGGREFGQYPFAIYGKEVLRIATFLIPMALFQYYPLLYLLGRETSIWYALAPLGSLLFAVPAFALWSLGLRHYKSTGS